jgi:hypothetical protein
VAAAPPVTLPEAAPGISAQFPGNERSEKEEQGVAAGSDGEPDPSGPGSEPELPVESAVAPAVMPAAVQRQPAAAGRQREAAEAELAVVTPEPESLSGPVAAIETATAPLTGDAPTEARPRVEPAPEAARPAVPEPAKVVSPAAPEPAAVARVAPEAPSSAPAVRRSTSGPALVLRSNEIVSPSVSRFQITDRIRRREPVGSIEDIREDSKVAGLVRVIVFSSVSNLAGQRITYRWRRGDQIFAEVPVSVGGNSWRSYSSKYLSNDMRGRWTVELVDKSGTVLALTEFDY